MGRSGPVAEAGGLPTVDVSQIETVQSFPRTVATTFGITIRAAFMGNLEGGAGDIMAMEMENSQIDHIKEINEELLAGSGTIVSGGGRVTSPAGYTFTVPASVARSFKVGDSVSFNDAGAADYIVGGVVRSVDISGTTGTVTTTITAATDPADGDVVFITNRAGFTSIDDVIQVGTAGDDTSPGMGGRGTDVGAYNIDVSHRGPNNWASGVVSWNDGVGRDLTLPLLDNAIRDVRIRGGEPKLILTNHDQYYRLTRLLQPQQRYLGYEEYQVGVGSEKTFPGTRGGMMLATYQGIPILADPDCPRSVDINDNVLGSNVYVLDTDFIEIGMALPTQYIENRDFFAANALVIRGLFYTLGELRVRNMYVQGAIRDLNE